MAGELRLIVEAHEGRQLGSSDAACEQLFRGAFAGARYPAAHLAALDSEKR
jgi:hypothetical protein